MPFAGWQQAFDPLLTPGARNYWKSHDFDELSDAAIDVVIDYAGKLPIAAVRDLHRPAGRRDEPRAAPTPRPIRTATRSS